MSQSDFIEGLQFGDLVDGDDGHSLYEELTGEQF
jgi:hypothetical protein